MPNWTDITLECEGLSDLDIFTEFNGQKQLDYNKIEPMPDCVKDTISPVRTDAVLCYLFTEYSEEDARKYIEEEGISVDSELLKKTPEEIIALKNKQEFLGFGNDAEEISAYDLGKNYITAREETGFWDWYDWAYGNWGVKWNASDSYLEGDTVSFLAPWGYPDKVFEKLAKMFPDKEFHSEVIYEDEPDLIHEIEFSANHWDEYVKPNEAYFENLMDNLEFKLGFYDQRNSIFAPSMEESKVYGIAIKAYEDGEPYATCTVNLPGPIGEHSEMIGIKNAAYVDTNNCPWVSGLISKGFAVDTGITKRSGFCEYPLYQFNEEWLKSLETVIDDISYDDYEKKYIKAMGLEDEELIVNDKYPIGARVKLEYMDGEDSGRMYYGLMGTIKSVDDMGQIHVSWDNGSSLALNTDVDSFEVIKGKELSIRPVTEEEWEYTYTQKKNVLENAGCIGHLRIDMGTTGTDFYTDWTDHFSEIKDDKFKKAFDYVVNEMKNNPKYGNILTDRKSMKNYCDSYNYEANFGDYYHPVYGFRVDDGEYSCLLRLDPSIGNYAAYIYAYETQSLDRHLEDRAKREKITVLDIEPGKEPKVVEMFNDLESFQDAVGGYIECIYPWDDNAAVIVNEDGKLKGLSLNRALKDDRGEVYDVVAGPMLITGLTEDSFGSLSKEQIENYKELFKNPELILFVNKEIKVIKENEYAEIPIYLESSEYAKNNGEMDLYRASFKMNVECKKAIEESLSAHFSDNRLDSKAVYDEVVEKFGEERVKTVLANTCIEKNYDKRIRKENMEWAEGVPLPDGKNIYGDTTNVYFVCEKPHISVVDAFCNKVRTGFGREKESVLEKLDNAKKMANEINGNNRVKKMNKGIDR